MTHNTTSAQAADRIRALVEDWRRFAAETTVLWRGHSRSWKDHVAGAGFGGARPLREYLARNCAVERILFFRDLRLFPDAPGQHSMVIVGTRLTPPSSDGTDGLRPEPPRVSIYQGKHVPTPVARVALLDAMRLGRDAAQVKGDGAQAAIRIDIDRSAPEKTSATLTALIKGAAQQRVTCGEIGKLQVPVDPAKFVELYERDAKHLLERVQRYRTLRESIDCTLEEDLAER